MRARARPPYYRSEEAASGPPIETAQQEGLFAGLVPAFGLSTLALDLETALADEDYEKAAVLRDRMQVSSGKPNPEFPSLLFLPPFWSDHGLGSMDALDGDVVLQTTIRLVRNLSKAIFPRPGAASTRASFGLDGRKDLAVVEMASLSDNTRRSLIENGYLLRSFTLAPDNAIMVSKVTPYYAILDFEDHLQVIFKVPGLSGARAANAALSALESFGPDSSFAFDAEFGFLSSRLNDCGNGLSFKALLHLPALGGNGLIEKAFRGLLARGLAVRGFFGSDEGSVGDVYEISTDRAFGQTMRGLAEDFEAALRAVVQAERKSREEMARNQGEELIDRAGRALGLFRNCCFLGESEAASALSALRIAACCGLVENVDIGSLGRLARRLGPGNLALYAKAAMEGEETEHIPVARRSDDRRRAQVVSDATKEARMRDGGSACSEA